jgi:transposase
MLASIRIIACGPVPVYVARHVDGSWEQSTRFVGMDVHKDTFGVAVTATGEVGKAMAYGTFPNTAAALETLVKRLRQAGSGPLKFCYEAGPCGYGVHRTLTRMGEDCMTEAGPRRTMVLR